MGRLLYLKALRAQGNAYPNDFRKTDFADALHRLWGGKNKEELEKEKPPATVAGRQLVAQETNPPPIGVTALRKWLRSWRALSPSP